MEKRHFWVTKVVSEGSSGLGDTLLCHRFEKV